MITGSSNTIITMFYRARESEGEGMSHRGQSSGQDGSLSWQERVNTMAERIRHSFMNSELSDITFLVGPEKLAVPAHKTLLSFCSPVFQAQFNGPLSNAESSVIEITDMDSDTFINFLSVRFFKIWRQFGRFCQVYLLSSILLLITVPLFG